MQSNLTKPTSSLVQQLCGVPELLAGLTLLTFTLTWAGEALVVLHLLWGAALSPLLWSRFRLRLAQSGVGYQPLGAWPFLPVLGGVAILLLVSLGLIIRFAGPLPAWLVQHPAVAVFYGSLVALTGFWVALRLRWLRLVGYSVLLLLGSASILLGTPEPWPFLATGLLMVFGGLTSFRRFVRRHPQVICSRS
jgi:hypothetical protein